MWLCNFNISHMNDFFYLCLLPLPSFDNHLLSQHGENQVLYHLQHGIFHPRQLWLSHQEILQNPCQVPCKYNKIFQMLSDIFKQS
jgi:hypothetical protein